MKLQKRFNIIYAPQEVIEMPAQQEVINMINRLSENQFLITINWKGAKNEQFTAQNRNPHRIWRRRND